MRESLILNVFINLALCIIVANVLLYLIQMFFSMYFMTRLVRILRRRRDADPERDGNPSAAESGTFPFSLRSLSKPRRT